MQHDDEEGGRPLGAVSSRRCADAQIPGNALTGGRICLCSNYRALRKSLMPSEREEGSREDFLTECAGKRNAGINVVIYPTASLLYIDDCKAIRGAMTTVTNMIPDGVPTDPTER
jgi:hypothetical protein